MEHKTRQEKCQVILDIITVKMGSVKQLNLSLSKPVPNTEIPLKFLKDQNTVTMMMEERSLSDLLESTAM